MYYNALLYREMYAASHDHCKRKLMKRVSVRQNNCSFKRLASLGRCCGNPCGWSLPMFQVCILCSPVRLMQNITSAGRTRRAGRDKIAGTTSPGARSDTGTYRLRSKGCKLDIPKGCLKGELQGCYSSTILNSFSWPRRGGGQDVRSNTGVYTTEIW